MRVSSPVLICSLSALASTGCAERPSRVSQIPPGPPVIAVSAPDGVIRIAWARTDWIESYRRHRVPVTAERRRW